MVGPIVILYCDRSYSTHNTFTVKICVRRMSRIIRNVTLFQADNNRIDINTYNNAVFQTAHTVQMVLFSFCHHCEWIAQTKHMRKRRKMVWKWGERDKEERRREERR